MKRFQHVLAVLVALTLLVSCSNNEGGDSRQARGSGSGGPGNGQWGKPDKPQFKIPVTVEKIQRDRMFAYLQAVGTVVPTKEIEMKPEMTGRIYYTKRWLEGNQIKKGEVFATIDDRQLRLEINEAELQLELAKASLRPAKAQLDQAIKDAEFKKIMQERGAISKAEYDLAVLTQIQRENQYEEAQQNIESRRMALERMKQELEKVEIVAPFDGVLLPSTQSVSTGNSADSTAVDLTLLSGQTVSANAVLCRLAVIDQVYVALDIPAKDLAEVRIGQDVELDIFSQSGNKFRGTVSDISTSLNANTRTYTVNVLVDNPNRELRPGMFAKAKIITDERLDAISIPRSMVQLRNNQHIVFVAVDKQSRNNETDDLPSEPLAEGASDTSRQFAMAGRSDRVAFAGEQDPATNNRPDFSVESNEDPDAPKVMVAEQRVIERGIENREEVEIVSGLREGEYLVVLGYETLTDGVDVNVTIREDGILSRDAGTAQNSLP